MTGHPQRLQPSQIITIAHVAHEANRAYCIEIGDGSQKPWHEAEDWQRESAMNGVVAIAHGRVVNPGDSHRSWMKEKEETGWKYGPVKNPEAKEHHCMVPFDELPTEEQVKDHLFVGVVKAMLGAIT